MIYKVIILKKIIFLTLTIFISHNTFSQTKYRTIITYADRDSIEAEVSSMIRNAQENGKMVTVEKKYYINKKEVDKFKYETRKYADSIMFISNRPFLIITLDLDGDTISKAFINTTHLYSGPYLEFYKNGKIKIKGNYYDSTIDTTKFESKGILQSEIVALPFGYKDGNWVYYDINGELINIETFVKGEKK
jgi:antitoxin component YwqK of YwqJK toxin-antitoxin module